MENREIEGVHARSNGSGGFVDALVDDQQGLGSHWQEHRTGDGDKVIGGNAREQVDTLQSE